MKRIGLSRKTRAKWAYLAGIIDGEGWIGTATTKSKKDGGRYPVNIRTVIANTDIKLIEWITSHFEGTITRYSYQNRWKTLYMLEWKSSHVPKILKGVLPFLVIKRRQAEEALALSELCGLKYCSTGRGSGLSDELLSKRRAIAGTIRSLNARGKQELVEEPTKEVVMI